VTVPPVIVPFALACASGLLSCLAFPPVGLWPLAFIAPWPLALAVAGTGRGAAPGAFAAARAVFAASILKWGILHAWLVQVTAAGTPALVVYCSLHDALAAWMLVRAMRAAPRAPLALLVPLVFGASEAFRAMVLFDGYPWFRWGHPLVEWPVVVQAADAIGELHATLLALVVAGGLADAVRGRRAAGFVLAGAALSASLGYGAWRLAGAPTGDGPAVLAIQTNLPTSNKVAWSPQDQVRDLPSFAQLTLEAARAETRAGRGFDLVAWPETMLPGFGLEPATIELQEANGWFPGDRFRQVAAGLHARLGVPLIVGSPAFIGLREGDGRFTWDRQFNSAYLVDRDVPPYTRYDKVFLAPFGETMPYISRWDWLERSLLALGAQGMTFDLDAGAAPVRFDVPWAGGTARVAVPICFEDAMTWVCRMLCFDPGPSGRVRRADLMVCISNDGWFGWFDGGRMQHLQLSRFRCIENRTPMVRVANSGACAGIDSSGRVVASPPEPRTAAWLRASLPLDARTPPFAAMGEVASIALMTACALSVVASFRIRRAPGAAMFMTACAVGILQAGCGDSTVADQPWSSRSQSIEPTGQARLAESGRPVQVALPVESSGSAHMAAVALLRQACASQVPMYRANAVEALIASPEDLRAVVTPLLSDPNRGVRFVAAMSVGRAGLVDLADRVQPLLLDESASVRAAAICALTRLGRPVDPTPLAAMVRSDDPEVRSNAYLVLGEMGNRSAILMIRDSLGKGMRQVNPARVRITELQAAEALVRLGEEDGIEPIRAALFAPGEQAEYTALAAQQVARLKDDGSRAILMRLIDGTGISARPTEVRIGCALALAETSPQDAQAVIRFARTLAKDREPVVRAQAALALAYAGGAAAVPEIEPMLLDPDPTVQLAVAKGLIFATSGR
jgi:apolipoprotein N-acyltransferase